MRGASYLKPPVQSVGYSDQCILNSDSFSFHPNQKRYIYPSSITKYLLKLQKGSEELFEFGRYR